MGSNAGAKTPTVAIVRATADAAEDAGEKAGETAAAPAGGEDSEPGVRRCSVRGRRRGGVRGRRADAPGRRSIRHCRGLRGEARAADDRGVEATVSVETQLEMINCAQGELTRLAAALAGNSTPPPPPRGSNDKGGWETEEVSEKGGERV